VTIDRSLKRKGRLARSRNVLKRHERIAQMEVEDKWLEGASPLGIPKTRVIKLTLGKKKKVKAEAAEGDDKKPAKGAAAAKGAAPAKGAAAPAAGAAAKKK
jgi:small basic protein (TIGR04137 family)